MDHDRAITELRLEFERESRELQVRREARVLKSCMRACTCCLFSSLSSLSCPEPLRGAHGQDAGGTVPRAGGCCAGHRAAEGAAGAVGKAGLGYRGRLTPPPPLPSHLQTKHIAALIAAHEKAFADIKQYYNEITHSNLDLIKILKDEVEHLKVRGGRQKRRTTAQTREGRAPPRTPCHPAAQGGGR
jgi:hypothetical protein